MSRLTGKDWMGLGVIGLCLVTLGGAGCFAAHQHGQKRNVDPMTLCLKGASPAEITDVVIDMTDPLTRQQAQALYVRLRHLALVEIRKGEMLTVWGLGDYEDGSLRRLFCRCNPGRDGNWFYQDPAGIEAKFDSLFGDTLARVARSLTLSDHAATSPVLESIQELTELPEFSRAAGTRRLILVSDMLQNTRSFSNYRSGSDYEPFRQSAAYRALRAELRGTLVEVVYLSRKRDGAHQGSEHRAFWRQYLKDCGAERVEFSRL